MNANDFGTASGIALDQLGQALGAERRLVRESDEVYRERIGSHLKAIVVETFNEFLGRPNTEDVREAMREALVRKLPAVVVRVNDRGLVEVGFQKSIVIDTSDVLSTLSETTSKTVEEAVARADLVFGEL